MDNFWMLYLVTRLDSLSVLFEKGLIISSVSGIISLLVYLATHDSLNDSEREVTAPLAKKWIKLSATTLILCCVLKVVVPTKEDAMFIAAGVAITEVAQSEQAKRIASGSVRVIEAWLAKQEKELKQESE